LKSSAVSSRKRAGSSLFNEHEQSVKKIKVWTKDLVYRYYIETR
jgi:hypothetical protein